MNKGTFDTIKVMLTEIFNSVSLAIGIHVLLIVLERSLWKVKIKYPEASKIHFSEEGIFIDELYRLEPGLASKILDEFVLSIIDTLGRLIGIQAAEKLTDALKADSINKGEE